MTKHSAANAGQDVLGFDHPHGASKIFKAKTPSSRKLKAAYMYGPTLEDLSHNECAKKYKRHRRNKKARRIRETFVQQRCAPVRYRYEKKTLEKVSDTGVVELLVLYFQWYLSQIFVCQTKISGGAPCLRRRGSINSVRLVPES